MRDRRGRRLDRGHSMVQTRKGGKALRSASQADPDMLRAEACLQGASRKVCYRDSMQSAANRNASGQMREADCGPQGKKLSVRERSHSRAGSEPRGQRTPGCPGRSTPAASRSPEAGLRGRAPRCHGPGRPGGLMLWLASRARPMLACSASVWLCMIV